MPATTLTNLLLKKKSKRFFMSLPLGLQHFNLGKKEVVLYVPRLGDVQKKYQQQKKQNSQAPFPYWAQVWPAAVALSRFVVNQPKWVSNKTVLELAAGLGLPSLAAAPLAQKVTCTDNVPAAVEVAQQSAVYNGFKNMHCQVLDWNFLPEDLHADVLLMSDVNYEPQQFEILYNVLQTFLQKGTTILLSTPQRLMAKPFIERLLPWCQLQQQEYVTQHNEEVAISVLVLSPLSP